MVPQPPFPLRVRIPTDSAGSVLVKDRHNARRVGFHLEVSKWVCSTLVFYMLPNIVRRALVLLLLATS